MWARNSGARLGPPEYYGTEPDDPEKQEIIAQQHLRYNILGLWIKNFLTTDGKRKLRAFRTAYNFNNQYYGVVIFFVMVKMVHPATRTVLSAIKSKLETMKMSRSKQYIPISNLHIEEWMN